MNPANRADTKFRIMNWGVYHYTEPGELPQGDLFKAALNLYLYTKAISPNPQEPFPAIQNIWTFWINSTSGRSWLTSKIPRALIF